MRQSSCINYVLVWIPNRLYTHGIVVYTTLNSMAFNSLAYATNLYQTVHVHAHSHVYVVFHGARIKADPDWSSLRHLLILLLQPLLVGHDH